MIGNCFVSSSGSVMIAILYSENCSSGKIFCSIATIDFLVVDFLAFVIII